MTIAIPIRGDQARAKLRKVANNRNLTAEVRHAARSGMTAIEGLQKTRRAMQAALDDSLAFKVWADAEAEAASKSNLRARLDALDVALPKLNDAAARAQRIASDPESWTEVCSLLGDIRRGLVELKAERFAEAERKGKE